MNRINFYLLAFVYLSIMTISCGDDAQESTINLDNGVLILNEGPFNGGAASIDFYDRAEDEVIRNVYSTVNDGQVIGSILQSATVIGDEAFLMVNNSSKIEVIEASTLKYKSTITGIYGARYMVDLGNGNAAISEWGLDGVSGQLKLLDLSTLEIIDSVSVSGPEQMIVANNKLYVANSGGFGESDKVSVHGLDLAQQIAIPVGSRTIDMVQDIAGDIWVLSGGSFVNNEGANLCRIKNDIVQECKPLSGNPSDLIIDAEGTSLYYVENALVNKMDVADINSIAVIGEGIINGTVYGLGYDGKEEALFIGTSADFSSESTTYIIYENGDASKSFMTGVLTNGFIFR